MKNTVILFAIILELYVKIRGIRNVGKIKGKDGNRLSLEV